MRGLMKATNSGENFEGWVVGFYGEWSDTLAKLPEKLADAQVVRWQSKYGHHQEPPEYAREVPPTHGGAEKDGTGVSGLGPPARQGTTHGRTFRPHHRVAVVVEPWDGQDPPADSI